MSLKSEWTQDLRIRKEDMVNSVAISDDASRVAAATWYHNYSRTGGQKPLGKYAVYLLDGTNGNVLWLDQIGKCYQGIYSVAISGSGNVVAAGGWLNDPPGPQPLLGLVRAYDSSDGTKLFPADATFPDRVNSVALSADGRVLVAGADELYVFLAEVDDRFLRPPLLASPPTNPVNSLAIDPTRTWIVSCHQGGNVCLTTITGGALDPTILYNDNAVPFHPVAIARSTDFFVAGGSNFVYLFSQSSMA